MSAPAWADAKSWGDIQACAREMRAKLDHVLSLVEGTPDEDAHAVIAQDFEDLERLSGVAAYAVAWCAPD